MTALKAAVGAALSSGGYTNWEDALFRMFRNSDGMVQQVLPSTLIVFTDGMPTYNRLNCTSATESVVATHRTVPVCRRGQQWLRYLPAGSWDRANRVLREYDVDLREARRRLRG